MRRTVSTLELLVELPSSLCTHTHLLVYIIIPKLRNVAKVLKRSPATIMKYTNKPTTLEEVNEMREEIAGDFEDLARRALGKISDEELDKTSAYQKTLIAGISSDKATLLRGMDRSEKMQPIINITIRDMPNPKSNGDICIQAPIVEVKAEHE